MHFRNFMNSYNRGKPSTIRSRESIDEGILRKAFKMRDEEGNNILHGVIGLERSEKFSEKYNVERALIEEAEFIFQSVGPERFIRLLRQKNHQGISPLERVVLSKQLSESKDWREVASPYMQQFLGLQDSEDLREALEELSSHPLTDKMEKLLGEVIPVQNRGMAYSALKHVVKSHNWSWRAILARLPWGLVPAAAGAGTVAVGNTQTEFYGGSVIILAGAALCARGFKEWYDAMRVRRALTRF